jgi:hypothetical protein
VAPLSKRGAKGSAGSLVSLRGMSTSGAGLGTTGARASRPLQRTVSGTTTTAKRPNTVKSETATAALPSRGSASVPPSPLRPTKPLTASSSSSASSSALALAPPKRSPSPTLRSSLTTTRSDNPSSEGAVNLNSFTTYVLFAFVSLCWYGDPFL